MRSDAARNILTLKEFEVWEAREIHGWTLRRTAGFFNISVSSVRDRLANADRRLRHHSRADFAAKAHHPVIGADACTIAVALLVQRDGNLCYLCRREFHPTELTVEHIVPRARGGTNSPENLALACADCNLTKGAKYVSLRVPSGRAVYHHG